MYKIISKKIEISYMMERTDEISMFITYKNFISKDMQKDIFQNLLDTDDWKSGDIKRLQKWYHDEHKYFSDYWKNKEFVRWISHIEEEWLTIFKNVIIDKLKDIFDYIYRIFPKRYIKHPDINSILLNYYRNGTDSIHYHKDDDKLFGINPTIVIATFGCVRPLRFKRTYYNSLTHNHNEKHLNRSFSIEEGDLFLMLGSTQKYYCHGIEKDLTEGPRYSITFREHIIEKKIEKKMD